jgi:hypothetical protein
MSKLDALMAPYRKKVLAVLEADKTGQYKTYLADLEAFSTAKDPQKEQELADKLKRDHYAFIKKAYTQAVINHEEMKRGIAEILKHNSFTLDEFGGINGNSFLPLAPLPLKFDAELTAPYEAAEEDANAAALSTCTANVSTTQIKLKSKSMYAGGCRSKGSLGDKFDLPAGTFQKITLSAQVDFEYFGRTVALGGYGQVNTKIGVRLIGPGGLDKVVIIRERWAVSPVIWYTEYTENIANFMAQNTFSGTFNGGNSYTTQAYSETFAIGGVLGGGRAECEIREIDFIKVSAKD